MVDAIRRLLGAGDLAGAGRLLDGALATAPRDAELLHLRGHLHALRGEGDAALAAMASAVALDGRCLDYLRDWSGLAASLGKLRGARDGFATLLARDPRDAEAAMGLGFCARQLDGPAAAGPCFVRAAAIDPSRADAVAEALTAAHELVVAGARAPEQRPPPLPAVLPTISVIVCSITPWKLAALDANLRERLSAASWERVHIDDARSLAEGYQRGIARSRGEVLILCHDDIEILDQGFLSRLVDALAHADLVGVAGTTRFAGPTLTWAGAGHVHGWVAHGSVEDGLGAGAFSLAYPRVESVEALDGMFFAARRGLFDVVDFDPRTFDGFHGYDLDFSHRCHRAGLRVAVHTDLWLRHLSGGRYDDSYRRYAGRLCERFPGLPSAPEQPVPGAAVAVADGERAVALYRWLSTWCRAAADAS